MLGLRVAFREFSKILALCLPQFIHQPGDFFGRGTVFDRFGQFILRTGKLLRRLLQIAVLNLKRQYPKRLGCGLKICSHLQILDDLRQNVSILCVTKQRFRSLRYRAQQLRHACLIVTGPEQIPALLNQGLGKGIKESAGRQSHL